MASDDPVDGYQVDVEGNWSSLSFNQAEVRSIQHRESHVTLTEEPILGGCCGCIIPREEQWPQCSLREPLDDLSC